MWTPEGSPKYPCESAERLGLLDVPDVQERRPKGLFAALKDLLEVIECKVVEAEVRALAKRVERAL